MICLCSRLSVPLSLLFFAGFSLLYQVYLGLTDVTKLELAQLHEVETIIIHPGWNLLTKVRRPITKALDNPYPRTTISWTATTLH